MAAATTPNCEIVQPLLSPYLDDEATPTEAALVEMHIAICGRCASDLAFLRRTHAVLAHPIEVLMPARLSARIAAATYARPSLGQRLAAWLRPAPARLALGSALAAAGVIAASALLRGGAGPVAGPSGSVAGKPEPEVVAAPKQEARSAARSQKKGGTQAPTGVNPGPQKQIATRDDNERAIKKTTSPPARRNAAPDAETRTVAAWTPAKISEKPAKNPSTPAGKPAPTRGNPVVARLNQPPISPQGVSFSSIAPSAAGVVKGSDALPTEAPPAAPPETRVRVATTGRSVSGALRDNGTIQITRSPEPERSVELVHVPFLGTRSSAIRPVGFSEPGQPLEASVAFVKAPGSLR